MTKSAKGWAFYQRDQRQEGLALMRETVPLWLEEGVIWTAPYITLLAESLIQENFISEALDVITRGLAIAERDGVLWYKAELHRVKGATLRREADGDPREAEAEFETALEIARDQGAKTLELRATNALAELWRDQGRSDEDRVLLEPIYEWFTEGRDSRDLQQAKRLLESFG